MRPVFRIKLHSAKGIYGMGAKKPSIDEQILRTTKEIIVKFIETGRVSPNGFSETFKQIYTTIDQTVKESLDTES